MVSYRQQLSWMTNVGSAHRQPSCLQHRQLLCAKAVRLLDPAHPVARLLRHQGCLACEHRLISNRPPAEHHAIHLGHSQSGVIASQGEGWSNDLLSQSSMVAHWHEVRHARDDRCGSGREAAAGCLEHLALPACARQAARGAHRPPRRWLSALTPSLVLPLLGRRTPPAPCGPAPV